MNDDCNKELKKQFLTLLDDKDIQCKIKELIIQTNIKENFGSSNKQSDNIDVCNETNILLNEIELKDMEIKIFKNKINQYEEHISQNENKIEILEGNINEQNLHIETIKKENILFKKKYKSLEDIYSVYENLSNDIKESMRGIFKGNTLEEFLFCGIQYENIELFWDYIKNRIINGNYDGLEELNMIFTYFFENHNKVYDGPIFARLENFAGKDFDDDVNIRTGDSRVNGNISEVLFEGYINNNTNNVERKTIVRV